MTHPRPVATTVSVTDRVPRLWAQPKPCPCQPTPKCRNQNKNYSIRIVTLAAMLIAAAPAWASDPSTTPPTDPYAHNACVQCHRDLPGRSAEIVGVQWRHSVHYAANVGCDGCHGGDASLTRDQFDSDEAFKHASHQDRNPEFLILHRPQQEFVSEVRGRSVSYFCGRCHAEIKEKHLGSPHGDFGDPTCLYCHGQGSHLIQPATTDIIDTRSRAEAGRCSPCHAAATMQAVARIKKIMVDTEQRIETSDQAYQQLEASGYQNLELQQMHHAANEVHSKLRRIFHSFNMLEINNFAAEIESVADRTTATHDLVERLRRNQRQQTIVGLCAVALLLSFAGLLVYYKRSFLDEHH